MKKQTKKVSKKTKVQPKPTAKELAAMQEANRQVEIVREMGTEFFS
jgi:hypothetical protein